MGLLLSILVVCVGVIEALSCYEHFQYGVLHCATNVYERARRRSSVFLKYTSRRLRLLAEESVEEEAEPLLPPEPRPPPQKPPTRAPPAPTPPARLGKEDKIKIVKTLLEKPSRPRPVRSVSMPEPIFSLRDELTDIIDSLAVDTIEEVNIEVEEDAELLTNEFEKLFEEYENDNTTPKRSETEEREVGMVEKGEKPEERPKVAPPVVAPPEEAPKEPPKSPVGAPVDVKVQPQRPSRPSRSVSLDCGKSAYADLVSSYFAKEKSFAPSPKKSKSRARRLDKLDDVTVKSDTPPVELIDETFEEIYKDVCVDADDVTDFEEIEKSVLEEEDAGIVPENEEPPPIAEEVLLKAAQQLAEIIVRNLLKDIPRLSLGKPNEFSLVEIPPRKKKPGTDGRSAEDDKDLEKQKKMVLEEERNGWTDAEEKEVEEEIQKITSKMGQIGVPMEVYENEKRDTQKGRKQEGRKADTTEDEMGTGKDKLTEKDKLQDPKKVQSAIPTTFGDVVEEEIQKITSTMSQSGAPTTLDRTDGRDTQNVFQQDREKQDGKFKGVQPDTAVEKQIQDKETEKDKRDVQKEGKEEDRKLGDAEAVTSPERHEATEKDQPGDPAAFGNSVAEEIPKTIATISHFALPMEENVSEGKDIQELSKLEEWKLVCTEADNDVEKQVVEAEKDKQKEWDKLFSEGPTDNVEEIRKILSPIIKAARQMGDSSNDEKDIQKAESKEDGRVGDTEADASIGKPVIGESAEKDKLEDQKKMQSVDPTASEDSMAEEIPEIISMTEVYKELRSSDGEDIQKARNKQDKEKIMGATDDAGVEVKEDIIHLKPSQKEEVQNEIHSKDPTAFGDSAKTEIIIPNKEAISSSEELNDCDAEKDKICTKTVVATTHTQPGIDSDTILPKEDVSNLQDKQEKQSTSTAVGASVEEERKHISPVSGTTCPELIQNEAEHPSAVRDDTGKAENKKEERNETATVPDKAGKFEENKKGSSSQLEEERQIKDILKKIGIPTEIADGDFVEVEITLEGDQFTAKPQEENTTFAETVNKEDNLDAGDKQNTTVQQQYSQAGGSVEEEIKKVIEASKVGVESSEKHKQKDGNKECRRDDGSKAVEEEIEIATGKERQQKQNGVLLEGPTAFADSVEEEFRKVISTMGLEQTQGESEDGVEPVKTDGTKLPQEGGVPQKGQQQNKVQSADQSSFGDVAEEVISTQVQEFQVGIGGESKHDKQALEEERTNQQKDKKELLELEIKSEIEAVGKPAGEITPQMEKTQKRVEDETATVKPTPGEDIKILEKSDPTAEEGNREIDNKNQQRVLQEEEVLKLQEKVEPTEENWGAEESSNLETGPPGNNKPGPRGKRPEDVTDSNNDVTNSAPEAFWLIFSGEYTKAMSKDWHSGHFSCWQCDEALTGQRYVLRDDHPYCIKCYESVFANVCEECNKIIGIDSKDLSYKDKHWHEACFLCNKCRVSLVDKQFGSKADKIYCGNCYDAQFASRCDGCGEIFRAGTKKMEYKTRQWHEKCFCCCVCKTPIGTKSFIPREQEIYCATCYEEKFATRCVKCNKIITSGGVTYKNEPWHRECFTCTNCNTSLAGQRFTSRDEKPYCADCFGELFAKRCTACSRPITGIGGTRFISFEDRHWHNDCFICASCKTSLVGRGFITDGDDIICPECAKQKLM